MARLGVAGPDVGLAELHAPLSGHDAGAAEDRTCERDDSGTRRENGSAFAQDNGEPIVERCLQPARVEDGTRAGNGAHREKPH